MATVRWLLVFAGVMALAALATLELIFVLAGYLFRGKGWLQRFTSWH